MSAAKLAAPCVFVELGLAGAVLVMGWSGVEGVRVLPLPCSPNCALGCPPPRWLLGGSCLDLGHTGVR